MFSSVGCAAWVLQVAEALGLLVAKPLNNFEIAVRHLQSLVKQHVKVGISLEDYLPVVEALMATLEHFVGPDAWRSTSVAAVWTGVTSVLINAATGVYADMKETGHAKTTGV